MTPELETRIVSLVNRPDPTILDIGCNDGTDTLAFLSLFPNARVFSFEPDPRAIRRFLSVVQDPRAWLIDAAVGAIDGQTPFHQSGGHPSGAGDWDLSGSIRKPKAHLDAHPWCTFERQIDVPVIRLDTWATVYGVREADFLWADVQGAEGDLIMGGMKTLASTHFFYTEYSNNELYLGQPTLSQLQSMLPNFETMHVYPNDVLFRNTAWKK